MSFLGAVAGAATGAAQGLAPALNNTLQRKSRDQQATLQRRDTQRYRDAQLEGQELARQGTEDYRTETLAQRQREAELDHSYRIRAASIREAELELDWEKLRRTQSNSGTDPRARQAERAADALTRHMERRPLRDPELSPEEYAAQLADWEHLYDQLPKLHGFGSDSEIQDALGGRPSTHNTPGESGNAQLGRDLLGRAIGESPSQRLVRLQEETGINYGDYAAGISRR